MNNIDIVLIIIIVILIMYIIHLKMKFSILKTTFDYIASFYSSINKCFEEYKKADKIEDSDSSMNIKKECVKAILDICEEARNFEEKFKEEFNIK